VESNGIVPGNKVRSHREQTVDPKWRNRYLSDCWRGARADSQRNL